MSDTRRRRHDPDLRDRILEATLDVIAAHGVAGTTHRKVAQAADVSLGSLTHRFACLDDLLVEAFRSLTARVSARYRETLDAAASVDDAREAVAHLICGEVWTSPRTMALTYELYAYGTRNSAIRQVQLDWMAMSHASLERHFPPQTARILDAFLEGATIHNATSPDLISRADVRRVIDRLTQ